MRGRGFLDAALRASAVVLLCAAGVVGCSKDEPKVDPSAPQSYMHDKAFMKKMDDAKAEQRAIMKKHQALLAEYRAETAKDPSGARAKELRTRVEAAEAEYQASRKRMLATVAARLNPNGAKKGGRKPAGNEKIEIKRN